VATGSLVRLFYGATKMEPNQRSKNVTVFFCQQLDPEQDTSRRSLEKELGKSIRFFPLPCSGRVEALHFLKALEAGADTVFLVTCPEGACRYGQGNSRAKKRVEYAKGLVREIGLNDECLKLVAAPRTPLSMDDFVRNLIK
jgi:F420-non-reducing hydrogenase iron-sulfur subunit